DDGVDFSAPPFLFPVRYRQSRALRRSGVRTFATTSTGRLFDTVAALVGFTRPITFEGQAAMWLEHLARSAESSPLEFPVSFDGSEIDWREVLRAIVNGRLQGVPAAVLARAFHRSLASGLAMAIRTLAARLGIATVVFSGGVMQNAMLDSDLRVALSST